MRRKILIELCYVCCFIVPSLALYKKWLPNTNFDNPSNWKAGRLPCSNDAIKFPERVPSVFVQMNATVHELILPMNGELVLSDFMSLSFQSDSNVDSSCIGQDNEFNATEVQSWFDPANWCEVTDPEASCKAEPKPRLDTERLPCQNDIAVFPRKSIFLVDLQSGVDIHIGKLIYQGREYSSGDFRSFMSTNEGKDVFHHSGGGGTTSVNIAGSLCTDATGCPCENNGGVLEEKVCSFQEDRCPGLTCVKPLLPDGHCCYICGYIMQLSFGPGFKMKTLEEAIYGSISRDARDSVKVIVSRTTMDKVQVVVEDVDMTGKAEEVVAILAGLLKPADDGTTVNTYRITDIQVATSDTSPTAHTGGYKKWGAGSIVSIVIAIVAVIAIVGVSMYCCMDRRGPNSESRPKFSVPLHWPFRRFSSEDDRRALELGPSVAFKDNVTYFGGGSGVDNIRGFDNPTYGGDQNMMNGHSLEGATASMNNNEASDVSTIDVSDPTFVRKRGDTGFSNPLYNNAQRIDDLSFLDATLKMNPVFTTEGLEEDSEI